MTGPLLGARFDVEVGAVAHGGHCVARHENRVVFVRHALPGERVTVVVTDDKGGSYCLADAVEVLTPSPDRVSPPCPYAGPGRCGGCDWQHADPAAQRRLKAAVVREQLERLGGVTDLELLPAEAEALPGGPLGWRTRVQFAVRPDGVPGLRKHRSHDVVPIERCLIASEDLPVVLGKRWPGALSVEAVASSHGDRAVVIDAKRPVRVPEVDAAVVGGGADRGHRRVREDAVGRGWLVHADGFWQVHPAAPDVLAAAVLEALAPRPDDTVLDLYSGVGLFAGALAGSVASVVAIEADGDAVADARRNLRDAPSVRIESGRVERVLARLRLTSVDGVVLDPPRSGAGRAVVREIASLRPRSVAYVACDPAALARDVRTFGDLGYALTRVRVIDAYPMTHHVECVATLVRGSA